MDLWHCMAGNSHCNPYCNWPLSARCILAYSAPFWRINGQHCGRRDHGVEQREKLQKVLLFTPQRSAIYGTHSEAY